MITVPAWLRSRRLEWLGTASVTAIAAWYWLRYFNLSTNLLDEGSTAAQGLRVLNGDLIYRDFFTVVTPASYYTVAWLFDLFGTSLMVLRWAAVVTGLGIFLVTVLITRRIAAWPFAAAAGLLTTVWGWFLGTPNFYSLEAALFSLIALGCYVFGAPSSRWMVLSGIVTGLTALTKQNVGAYTAAGLFITIWASRLFDTAHDVRGRLKMSGQFIAGIAIAVLPAVLWLIAAGAGPFLYESWVFYPLIKYTGRFALPYPGLPWPFPADPSEFWTTVVIHLPKLVYPLALVAIAVLGWRCQRRGDADARYEGHALLAITSVGLLTLLQAWPRADVTHILFGLQPTYMLFAYLLFCAWRFLKVVPGPRVAIVTLSLVVTLAPALVMLWRGYQRTDFEYQNYFAAVRTERAQGIRTASLEAQRIDVVTGYIREHTAPDDHIFVVPWAAGFYFLTDRKNPTRTDLMLFEDPEIYPCLLSRLEQQPPKYVIYGYTWDVDEKRFRDYAAPIDRYIRSRYAIEFNTDGYEIWRRLDDAPQAAGVYPRACQPRRFRISDLLDP